MNRIHLLLITTLLLSIAASCNLDYHPANAIEQKEAFRTLQDAKSLRNYFYIALRKNFHGENYYSTDVQADLLNATLSYGNFQGNQYSWQLYASDNTVSNLWAKPYESIANVNNFLDNVRLIPVESLAEQAELNRYIAEAHLTRAILYRSLVLRYAKDYEPASAGTDLGVPLVLHYNIAERPARATVAAVYDQIIADITAAKVGLSSVEGIANSAYLTADCITALEAQVYLDMHRYEEAAAAASALIDADKYPLVESAEGLTAMWTNDVSTETIFQPLYAEKSEAGNSMSLYCAYNGIYYDPSYVPQQWVVDLFDERDLRKQIFLKPFTIRIQGKKYNNVWLIHKYPGNPQFNTIDTVSNYVNNPKVFRIAEMYLIKAEALASKGNSDHEALAALKALQEKRGLTTANLTGEALKQEIQRERTREMLCEGVRLYDLKRWKAPLERKSPQRPELVLSTPAEITVALKKPSGDDKFVWGIPQNDILTNPHLIQNPGW